MQTQTEQLLSTTQTLKLVSSALLEKVAELMKVKKNALPPQIICQEVK